MTRTADNMNSGQPLGPLLIGLAGTRLSKEEERWLAHPAVGGVVLFSRNYLERAQLEDLTASINGCAGRRLLICVDHEGGRVQRFREGFTALPPPGLLGKMYAESASLARDFAYRHGRVMATELLLCGVDLSFAPVLDIGARSVVIGDRAFAAEPAAITDLAGAYIAGMHDSGMAATGKHFPGHGSAEADSHTDDVCDPRPLEEIERLDLEPFRALSSDLDAVMMAHVLYPAVDERPAGYSAFWIDTVLRRKLAFSGTVFSDDLGMYAARVAGGLTERVRDSLSAGCDAVLICDPDEVHRFFDGPVDALGNAHRALAPLLGRITSTREEVESVKEWRQWKKTLIQLESEQSRWP